MPTYQQMVALVRVCQSLSNMFQPIYLFRYDSHFKQIYMIAGINEGIEIIIFENGEWEFVENE